MGKRKKREPDEGKIEKLDKLRSIINQQKKDILRLERRIRELETDKPVKVKQHAPKLTIEEQRELLKKQLREKFGKKRCKTK